MSQENEDSGTSPPDVIIKCLSCKLNIYTVKDKDEHYKSSWHRYNVKRRAVGLPTMSKIDFDEKMALLKAEQTDKKVEVVFKCELCSKKFKSEGQMRTHLLSRKHKQNAKGKSCGSENLSETDAVIKEDYITKSVVREKKVLDSPMVPIQLKACLFCSKGIFETIELAMDHMFQAHGFQIPFVSKLSSLEGLLIMAGKIIGEGHACTLCWKSFSSKEAAWMHMDAMRHQTIDINAQEETLFDPYYDWELADQSISSDGISHHLVVPKRKLLCINEYGELEFDDGQIVLSKGAAKYHHHPNMRRLYNPDQRKVNLGANMIGGRALNLTTGPSKRELQRILVKKINPRVIKRSNMTSQMFFREQNPK